MYISSSIREQQIKFTDNFDQVFVSRSSSLDGFKSQMKQDTSYFESGLCLRQESLTSIDESLFEDESVDHPPNLWKQVTQNLIIMKIV